MRSEHLAGKNLNHVSLSGANLSDSDLSHASLRGAHLEGAKLQNTKLAGSDLQGAHLKGADVSGADLHNTNLTEADLRGVDLGRAASNEGVRLAGAKGVSSEVAEHAADDRVVSVHWDDKAGEADQIEHVVRVLARTGGFHDADWSAALTEQERQWYRRDARAAIAAIREYDAAHRTTVNSRDVAGDSRERLES